MEQANIAPNKDAFSLVLGGPLYQLYLRSGLVKQPLRLLPRRIFLFILITWVPLLLLTLMNGTIFGGVQVPFLKDLATHTRFLISIPLFLIGELTVHNNLRSVGMNFLNMDLIAPEDLSRFEDAVTKTRRIRNSMVIEVALLLIAFTLGYWVWSKIVIQIPTWFGSFSNGTIQLTQAGYWYAFVSLPIFRFLFLRWYFRIFVWYYFLWKVSRIPLQLDALHPDHAGGLGFLGRSVFAFGPVLLAQTALLSGAIGERIWQGHETLPKFTLVIASLMFFLIMLVLLPQLFFLMQMVKAKRKGNLEYSVQAKNYVTEFRPKWLEGDVPKEEFLGSSDIQSLADLGSSFSSLVEMRFMPFNKRIILMLGIYIILPLLPLALTMYPLSEVVKQLLHLLL